MAVDQRWRIIEWRIIEGLLYMLSCEFHKRATPIELIYTNRKSWMNGSTRFMFCEIGSCFQRWSDWRIQCFSMVNQIMDSMLPLWIVASNWQVLVMLLFSLAHFANTRQLRRRCQLQMEILSFGDRLGWRSGSSVPMEASLKFVEYLLLLARCNAFSSHFYLQNAIIRINCCNHDLQFTMYAFD